MTIDNKYIIFICVSISEFFKRLFKRPQPEPAALPEPEPVPEPEPPRPEERFILCIDGGGMRGIIPVVLLQELENCLRRNGGTADIASYFDLVSGTSTGGMISLALTSDSSMPHSPNGQINLDALLHTYMTMGDEIFQAKSIFGLAQMVSDKYHTSNIKNLCQRWFGAQTMAETKVPTLIMAYDITQGRPQMIRSYGEEASYPAWVAARATSAAPTYFSPMEWDGKLLVDGGVIANNPSIYAYFEAKKLYPGCSVFHILSLSTGGSYHTMQKDSTRGLINWADAVSPMYSTAQKRTTDYVLEDLSDCQYIRIDDKLSRDIKMDEINPYALQMMKHEAELSCLKHGYELEKFAKALIENMEYRTNASKTGRAGEEAVDSLPESGQPS